MSICSPLSSGLIVCRWFLLESATSHITSLVGALSDHFTSLFCNLRPQSSLPEEEIVSISIPFSPIGPRCPTANTSDVWWVVFHRRSWWYVADVRSSPRRWPRLDASVLRSASTSLLRVLLLLLLPVRRLLCTSAPTSALLAVMTFPLRKTVSGRLTVFFTSWWKGLRWLCDGVKLLCCCLLVDGFWCWCLDAGVTSAASLSRLFALQLTALWKNVSFSSCRCNTDNCVQCATYCEVRYDNSGVCELY